MLNLLTLPHLGATAIVVGACAVLLIRTKSQDGIVMFLGSAATLVCSTVNMGLRGVFGMSHHLHEITVGLYALGSLGYLVFAAGFFMMVMRVAAPAKPQETRSFPEPRTIHDDAKWDE